MLHSMHPKKKALMESNHVHIVLFSGSESSLSKLCSLAEETTEPIVVLWVSLPNLPDNDAKRDAFRKTRGYFATHYPTRNIIFADYMVRKEGGDEDFDSIGVSLFSMHLYHIIKNATVYWCTDSDEWASVDTTKLNRMNEIIDTVYSYQIVGTDKSKTDHLATVPTELQQKLGYQEG